MTSIEILRLRPIQIALKEVGAYPTGRLVTIPFPGPRRDVSASGEIRDRPAKPHSIELFRTARPPTAVEAKRSLANMIYLHDATGPGLSVVQDCVVGLFDLLSSTGTEPGRAASRLDLRPASQVQLDLLTLCTIDGEETEAVLSLWIGNGPAPIDWSDQIGAAGLWNAERWIRIGFVPDGLGTHQETDPLGNALLKAVRAAEGTTVGNADPSQLQHGSFGATRHRLPTVVQFGRGIMDRGPGYSPARGLTLEPIDDTLGLRDYLLTLSQEDRRTFLSGLAESALGDGQGPVPAFELLANASALVLPTSSGLLRLSALERYDRALLALHAAVMLHGTPSTIVLVDGIDGFFPPEDLEFLHRSLAGIVEASPDATVLLNAAHDRTITSFQGHVFPAAIVKGGARAAGFRI